MGRFTMTLLTLLCVGSMFAANIQVAMNSVSKTMSLTDKVTGEAVDVGTPSGMNYQFDAPAGTYVLTAYGTDGKTVNGTIELSVTEDAGQEFKVITCTAYATNSGWKADEDYMIEVEINTREGVRMNVTEGNSVTAGRKTFLALNGNSYYVSIIPTRFIRRKAI